MRSLPRRGIRARAGLEIACGRRRLSALCPHGHSDRLHTRRRTMLRNLWLARSTLLAFARSRVALLPLLAGVTFLGGTFPPVGKRVIVDASGNPASASVRGTVADAN